MSYVHHVERGDVTVEEGYTLRDYITRYAKREKDEQIDKIVDRLGVDRSLVEEFTLRLVNEMNINEFGRFDVLLSSIDRDKMRAFFGEREHGNLSLRKARMAARGLLERFVLEGGFDIDTYNGPFSGTGDVVRR